MGAILIQIITYWSKHCFLSYVYYLNSLEINRDYKVVINLLILKLKNGFSDVRRNKDKVSGRGDPTDEGTMWHVTKSSGLLTQAQGKPRGLFHIELLSKHHEVKKGAHGPQRLSVQKRKITPAI